MGAAGRGEGARTAARRRRRIVPVRSATISLVVVAPLLALVALVAPARATPASTFTDVSPTHPFYAEITWASGQQIVTGYDDGSFRPEGAVTRQAMAAFLFRFAVGVQAPPAVASFSDVSPGHPFFAEIEWLVAEGITTGYDDGTFRSSLPVSRQAMAAYLYRLAGAPVPMGDLSVVFTDVGRNHRFFLPITFLWDFGLAEGYQNGSFQPLTSVSRAATTAFLFRLDDLADGPAAADRSSSASPLVWVHRGR